MRVAALVVLVGCGRIGFAPVDDDDDASVTDARDVGAAACNNWGPFGSATILTGASRPSDDDWSPRIGRDDLTLLVDRWNGTDFDLSLARRTDPSTPFGLPAFLTDAATSSFDENGQFSPAEDRLYVLRDYTLHQYQRVGTGYTLELMHPNVTLTAHYWISDDELRAYWLNSSTGTTIFRLSTRSTTSTPFGPPTTLETYTFGNISISLALTPDELELVMSLPVTSTTDDQDLFRATRTGRQEAFGALEPLAINTARDDLVGSISTDATTLYVNLDAVSAGSFNAEIWVARRSCLD